MIHKLLSLVGTTLGKNKLSILIYHQVFQNSDAMRPSEPDAETFRWHMLLIKKYFKPLSITAALAHIKQGTLPANAICITFDDGYINNLEVAAPILKELAIPATVYIATGFSQGENMFNDRVIDLVADNNISTLNLQALGEESIPLGAVNQRIKVAYQVIAKIKYRAIDERKVLIDEIYRDNLGVESLAKMMTTKQIKQLSALGIDIGAHTVEHPILKVLTPQQQREQIMQCQNDLQQLLGQPISGFAYPNGKISVDYDEVTRDIVSELGFDYAVSTNWGHSTQKTDKYQLNRFTPWDKTPLKFHIRLVRNLLGL